jgi:arylsulfatase A-like enzyme
MMNGNSRNLLLGGAVLAAVAAGSSVAARTERPNVIVIFTDDHGYADLGVQGVRDDIRTPHIDRLAQRGVRFTNGYVTAPVCGPSRAGLISGQFQTHFGIYDNEDMPFEYTGTPLPERLRNVGYRTGMIGKLHLPIKGQKGENPRFWGFDEFFMKHGMFTLAPRRHFVTHSLDGDRFPDGKWMEVEGYRTDVHTEAALQFIDRNRRDPFFLYLAYFAPHTPLEATQKYLDRFPDAEPEARRYALAMISAIDDGVGQIVDRLEKHNLTENTLIFFISDNGAPLKCPDPNVPVSQLKLNEWNGSVNESAVGEKGMLAEAGIRVPFLVSWPGQLPAGQVLDEPVITLDVAPTVLKLAGAGVKEMDGVDLMPLMSGKQTQLSRDALHWAFGGQQAVRSGPWKYIRTQTAGEFLFNLNDGIAETNNVLAAHPEKADELRRRLDRWTERFAKRKPTRPLQLQLEKRLYQSHFPGYQ